MQNTVVMLLPQIDKQTEEVEVVYWLKKDGSFVEKDESICEVNSEEFTFELEAIESGILKIVAQAGTMLKTGETICEILVTEPNAV